MKKGTRFCLVRDIKAEGIFELNVEGYREEWRLGWRHYGKDSVLVTWRRPIPSRQSAAPRANLLWGKPALVLVSCGC